MERRLVFRPLAQADLDEIERFIVTDSPQRAWEFIQSIEKRCELLRTFPEQGRPREDLRAGLRMLAYDRRIVVLYRFDAKTVEVMRVFYGGRDYETLLRNTGEE